MRVMLRCEVDACFAIDPASQAKQCDIEGSNSNNADDLADAFSALRVSSQEAQSAPTPTSDTPYNKIKVIKGGIEVPQSSLIKIKTRSARNVETFDWTAAYIQLFIGQTPNLFTGVHRAGTFYDIHKNTMDSPELVAASKAAQTALKKLRRLLDEICYIVMHHDTTGRLQDCARVRAADWHQRPWPMAIYTLPDAHLAEDCQREPTGLCQSHLGSFSRHWLCSSWRRQV